MTHDELLAKIDTPNELHVPNADGPTKIYKLKSQHMKALRAVAELHKPDLENLCGECTSAGISMDSWELVAYPCPTIQAIKKELK